MEAIPSRTLPARRNRDPSRVYDGRVGIEEAFRSVCSTFPVIRVKDKVDCLGDLKEVYNAPCYEEAVDSSMP